MKNKIRINNRRYIGCKTKLLNDIEEAICKFNFNKTAVFADIFAGTGVVGSHFADLGYKTILNDTLYSNYVIYKTFLGDGLIDEKKLSGIISNFNLINGRDLNDNYFSRVYGNKYFSLNDAKKIGYIRDQIEMSKSNLSEREYFYLITSLMYATDKIANTVGHFESFLRKAPKDKNLTMQLLQINLNNLPADIYNIDANELVKKIKCDIAYIDPPYNARQYVNFYHVLENLARWNKPTEFEGNSMKFKRNYLKSNYCRKKAPLLFEELINNLDTKLIVVSYNNTYKAGSISSVNTISEEEIMNILTLRGTVEKKEINYNAFNAGKTELSGHKEYLYICKVKN